MPLFRCLKSGIVLKMQICTVSFNCFRNGLIE